MERAEREGGREGGRVGRGREERKKGGEERERNNYFSDININTGY